MDRTHAKYGARHSPHSGGGGSGGSGQFPGAFDDEPIPVDGERSPGPRAVGPPPVKLPNALRPRQVEDEEDEPQPVLVPRAVSPQAVGPQPVGTPPVGPPPVEAAPKIRAFAQRLAGKHEDKGWARAPNVSGTGAIHVRSFHCKLNTESFEFLDQQINEWLDAHPQYEVKFVTTGVGEWVGKTREPNMIVQVWV